MTIVEEGVSSIYAAPGQRGSIADTSMPLPISTVFAALPSRNHQLSGAYWTMRFAGHNDQGPLK